MPFGDAVFRRNTPAGREATVGFRSDRRVVLVPKTRADDGALIQQLLRLNYGITDAEGRGPTFPSDQRPVAAIADGSAEEALIFFASLPADLPKILISADVSFDARISAARANVDAVIQCPVDVAELSDWLQRFEDRRKATSISVLLVDDDTLTAELHAQILRASGIEVHVVTDPTLVIGAMETKAPDLILMDVHMPNVNGIEVARVIRQSNEYLLLPIVFLSAETDGRRQIMARKFSGDDFIVKPIDPKILVATVRLRAERSRSLRALVERDSLTGLLNHGRFKERVDQELLRARRTRSRGTFAMIDIDHFKQVNDRFGHPAGDKVIRTLARVLLGRLRVTDVIGRYGGEEFGIFFPDTAPEEARGVLNAIRESFSDVIFEAPMGKFSATFSAGIAAADTAEASDVIYAADTALYKAKTDGRNRIETSGSGNVPCSAP